MDYQANSDKSKEQRPEKKIEKVTVNEVLVPKKPLGRKFKDLFIEADFKSVALYVFMDVLIPAAKDTIVDSARKGVERLVYGESAIRRRNLGPGQRVTYQSPINRGYSGVARNAPELNRGPRAAQRNTREEFILASKEEAELVIERMNDLIDTYEVASVADLSELVGLPTSHIDNKWGWTSIGNAQVQQIREGYIIDLPPAEPIS